jgi:hypothetical protein
MPSYYIKTLLSTLALFFISTLVPAQNNFKRKYNNSTIYSGIEVGSKGVKMSIVEVGKNAKSNGAFNILKDTSINTDFISFSEPTFQATLKGLYDLYTNAIKELKIPSKRIFTVISSGVKIQAEKEQKISWINNLIDSFKLKVNEPNRDVEIVDVLKEAELSHLGIVPEARRYSTFLIEIGSGNTKGGFFPYGNTTYFKLFQLSWGTKSTANATEKRCTEDNSLSNYNRQLYKVLASAENSEIIYAVNSSGSYELSDNIAISGGIAWAVATLTHPELNDNPIVPVSFEEVAQFSEILFNDYASVSATNLTNNISGNAENKEAAIKEIKRVQQVFDQKALMAGTGLLLKIMRQFSSVYETKQFYLVKNGQVGWISAYVDENIDK